MDVKGSILVIDDQNSWRVLLKEILESEGHTVFTANTFQTGKNLLETQEIDIAIIDMRLVDSEHYNVQGLALLKEVRKHRPSAKAIILTGYPDDIQKKRAMSFHAYAYLEKVPDGNPFDIDKFRDMVTQLLSGN